MLQIRNVTKTYKTGDLVQHALKGVSLNLRDNEFVAILGPSGSGKTTLLNIIGGLDRYDHGDLIINDVSTKRYKDRDWDTYRNHTIGFVFQSYNLIPHQSVLSNVELALTISGVSRRQRRYRALKALEEVGLGDQAHKKPNQMSGGQMQRVAIARALVNNPDILLADEPTGALDTQTSIQVMDLLKQVAKNRLVVMVTHNPELANEYANRIVRLKDGLIIDDTNPYYVEDHRQYGKVLSDKKAHMSFLTALSLSFNNLLTKKGRTILTAFAGSIGIIGIALILSLSQGFQNYIDKIQEDTLSSYPLTITSDTADMTSAILSMVSDRQENQVDGNNVRERQYLTTMFSSIGTNDLKSLKQYLQDHENEYIDNVSEIKYSYSVSPEIYTIDAANKLTKLYPSSMWNTLYSSSATSLMSSMSASSGGMIFAEMPKDMSTIYDQYDMLAGRWPSAYDEMIIVLSEPHSMSDLLVYSLGLRDTEELRTIITSIMSQDEVEIDNEPLTFTYEDLMNIDLRLVKATDRFKYNSKYDIYEDMEDDDDFMLDVYDNSLKLKVVGVVCAKDPDSTMALSPGVNFSNDLTQYVIREARNTSIVKKQLENKDIDVFSGDDFDTENDKEESGLDFEDMISIDEDLMKEAFDMDIDTDSMQDGVAKDIEKIITDTVTNYATNIYGEAIKNVIALDTTILGIETNLYDLGNPDMMIPGHIDFTNNKLDLSQTSSYADTITPNVVKGLITNPYTSAMFKDYEAITNTFTDSDYENLASACKIMFIKYYELLEKEDYGLFENTIDIILTYDDSTGDLQSYKYGKLDNNIDAFSLYGQVAQSEDALNELSIIYNKIISSGSIANLTASVAETAIKSSAAVGSSLGDMFSGDSFSFDEDKFAEAFKFDMDEDELNRLMTTMLSGSKEKSYKSNLISLGFQDVDDPTSISFYFKDFEAKEAFMDFLDAYNDRLSEEDKISYTDITGILMSSVKTIVDSVTYVLIAFVSISLVVSSIMIAVITLISVMERTKEIGILRAMGASKRNVSSIFNAETFIIGLLSGLLGVGVTFAAIPPINTIIHNVTDNYDINAVLPIKYAIILVIIAVVLTIFAGIIPSRKASKQDPVIALRSE